MENTNSEPQRNHTYFAGALLWLMTLAFLGRVLGQMVQAWAPQPALPDFSSFQGSGLPYWFLLSAQWLILLLMARHAALAFSGKLLPKPALGKRLRWLGAVYMTGSLARLLVGLIFDDAPSWFHAWIPAVFHVVLASYVLVLAFCHRPGRSASSRSVAL